MTDEFKITDTSVAGPDIYDYLLSKKINLGFMYR